MERVEKAEQTVEVFENDMDLYFDIITFCGIMTLSSCAMHRIVAL